VSPPYCRRQTNVLTTFASFCFLAIGAGAVLFCQCLTKDKPELRPSSWCAKGFQSVCRLLCTEFKDRAGSAVQYNRAASRPRIYLLWALLKADEGKSRVQGRSTVIYMWAAL